MPDIYDKAPDSWKNQPEAIVEKGVEVLDALTADGMPLGTAIPIALTQARKTVNDTADGQWVTPHPRGWAVKREGADRATAVYDTQREAIDRAVDIARRQGTVVTVQGEDGAIRDRQSFRSRL